MSLKGKDSEGLRRSERQRKGATGSQIPTLIRTGERLIFDSGDEEVTPGSTPVEELSPTRTQPEAVATMAGRYVTRLKYRKFRGDGKEDVDDWLCEFNSTAAANQEDVATKLRVFQGLLKGEALHWYQDVAEPVRTDWDQLTASFLRTFREVGGEARTLGRLSKMSMKPHESVRRYGQRVRGLIHKLTPGIAASVQIEWYVAGLPDDMGFQVRQSRPQTLQEAMEAAQNYENSKQSLRQSRGRSKPDPSKRGKKLRNSKRKESSGSSDSTSTSASGEQTSDDSTSEDRTPPRRNTSSRGTRKDRERGSKVKEELPESKQLMKDIQSSLSAIKIHLAGAPKPRRAIPVVRNNVWCTRCGQAGHYPQECMYGPPGRVQYVEEEGPVYFTTPDYLEEEEEVRPVYQVTPAYGRGRGQPQLLKPRFIPGKPMTTAEQPGPSNYLRRPVSFERQHGLCFKCGDANHYANDCPSQVGQGAPLELPCQNCGHYGHTAPQCQQPVKPRISYKQVETPPREKTALNYGHNEGVDNPPT